MSSKSTQTKPTRKAKLLVWLRDLAIFAVLISGIIYWQSKDMLASDGSVYIPQQNLVSLQGTVMPMLADDKPDLIYFFAPWCQICSLSIGNLSYLDQNKINVVIIALDFDSKEEVVAFVQEHDIQATVFLGTNELKAAFSIQGYPSYYLIDDNNTVSSKSYGYSTAVGLKLREAFGYSD